MGWGQRIVLGERPGRTLLRTALWALLAYGLFGFVVKPVWTDGESMAPTIADRSLHSANLLAYRLGGEPRRGDVVVVRSRGRRVMYLKRVLGLPGETVAFERGQLLIDGVAVDEPYLADTDGDWTIPPQQLPMDTYFVAGDNRSIPAESHMLGLVKRRFIEGRLRGAW